MLTEKDEGLLLRYADGECRFWEKGRAERLLRENASAQSFLSDMESVRDKLRSCIDCEGKDVDLWSGIERRIGQEERAEFFLGRRRELADSDGQTFWSRPALWWVSGAVAAACLAVVILGPGMKMGGVSSVGPTALEQGGAAGEAAPEIRFVSHGVQSASEPIRLVGSRSAPEAIEVEWMRSDGRVRMIQQRNQPGTIFWVNRRRRTVPLSGGLAQNPESLRILNRNAPRAITIGNSR